MQLMEPDEIVWVETEGWELPLRRYAGEGPPVLLIHGLGANHRNWDAWPSVSLADHLQGLGWDVWVVVLPGDEASVALPGAEEPSIDDMVTVHLPAILERVRDVTGSDQWFGVGHSMGGMLLLATLDHAPEAVVTLGAAAVFESPSWLVRAGRRVRRGGGATQARRWAWTAAFNPVVSAVANRRHMRGRDLRGLARVALDEGSAPLGAQVRSWMRTGSMVDQQGAPLLDVTATVPVLLLGGGRDRLINVQDVHRTAELLPCASFVPLPEYGHLDLVLGRHVRDTVYPLVDGFLSQWRA